MKHYRSTNEPFEFIAIKEVVADKYVEIKTVSLDTCLRSNDSIGGWNGLARVRSDCVGVCSEINVGFWHLRPSLAMLLPIIFFMGCQIQPPSGTIIDPQTLGTVSDEIHMLQEENAEFAKFIVYQHEFEINLQQDLELSETDAAESSFTYEPEYRVRGHRLTPDGESHVRQIAYMIMNYPDDALPFVVIEQSDTSKRWDTRHRYPVHGNDELDEIRRSVVVESLYAFGVENADELVVVAPAYPSGLNAREAAAAYQNAIFNNGPRNGGLFGR